MVFCTFPNILKLSCYVISLIVNLLFPKSVIYILLEVGNDEKPKFKKNDIVHSTTNAKSTFFIRHQWRLLHIYLKLRSHVWWQRRMGRDLSDQSLVFQFCPREQFDNLKQLKIGKTHTHTAKNFVAEIWAI